MDLEAIEQMGRRAPWGAIPRDRVLIWDEIGRFEPLHPQFEAAREQSLERGMLLVATVLHTRHGSAGTAEI